MYAVKNTEFLFLVLVGCRTGWLDHLRLLKKLIRAWNEYILKKDGVPNKFHEGIVHNSLLIFYLFLTSLFWSSNHWCVRPDFGWSMHSNLLGSKILALESMESNNGYDFGLGVSEIDWIHLTSLDRVHLVLHLMLQTNNRFFFYKKKNRTNRGRRLHQSTIVSTS